MGTRISAELERKYLRLRGRVGPSQAARECGIARTSGDNIWKRHNAMPLTEWETAQAQVAPEPRTYEELDAEGRRAMDDFIFFCENDLHLWTRPFWLEVASHLSGMDSEIDPAAFNRVMLTFHPGAGKSTMLLAYILWRILRSRAYGHTKFSAIYVMRTETQSKRGLRQVKDWAEEDRIIDRYGRIKPTSADKEETWTKKEIVVAGMGGGKEPTLAVYGAGQSISGIRPHLGVVDDLVDEHNCDPVATEDLIFWWNMVLEPRIEPGGVLAVAGTYWTSVDLYHILAGRKYVEEDGTETTIWKHYKFKAHAEDRCPGDGTHPMYDPRTGEGCLLNPQRWSYRALMVFKQNDPDMFEMQYQQSDVAGLDVLCAKPWWFGGASDSGELFPGVVNRSRSAWEWPDQYDIVVATLDPSPTKYAAHAVLAYSTANGRTYLLDLVRRRIRPSEYRDLVREQTLRIRQTHPDFNTWVIERSGAVYLVETDEFQDLVRELGIQIIFHETNVNKSHPQFGVWGALQPEFKYGRLDVPYRTPEDRITFGHLEREALKYPFSGTDDTVMCLWFFFLHKSSFVAAKRGPTLRKDVPSWVRNLSLSNFRR